MRIVGIEKLDKTSKKTGNLVRAHIVHCEDDGLGNKELVCGKLSTNEYIDDSVFLPFFAQFGNDYNRLLGQDILILRNNRGFVEGLMVKPSPKEAGK